MRENLYKGRGSKPPLKSATFFQLSVSFGFGIKLREKRKRPKFYSARIDDFCIGDIDSINVLSAASRKP